MICRKWNQNWLFHNDIHNTGEITVNLPHDAMQTEKRLPGMKNGAAAGFFPGGRYVYKKKLFGEEEYRGKTVLLEFEGIYMKSSVYLNGEKIGGWIYGYTGFYVDLTDRLKIGEDNEILVVADNSQTPNSRWYTGSGIYRNVNLIVGDRRHILPDGISVRTVSVGAGSAPAVIEVAVKVSREAEECQVEIEVYEAGKADDAGKANQREANQREADQRKDKQGKESDSDRKLAASGTGNPCRIEVPRAKLWDAEHPNLYTVKVNLKKDGEICDTQEIVAGIRTLSWSAAGGLQVNGKTVKLRGGCIHHDNGILGACAFDKAEYRKIRLLKEAGFNAIRSAHNPCSKALLAACDRLGMYVMDETFDQWQMQKTDYDYGLYFDEEWQKDLEAMIRKDRNHPSVVIYSIGNEIADTGKESGAKISRMLTEYCHEMDGSRPVTNGINPVVSTMGGALNNGKTTKDDVVDPYQETKNAQATASLLANMIATAAPFISKMMGKPKKVEKLLKPCFDEIDIVGYNYADHCYEPHHEYDPKRIMVGSETYPQSVAMRWPLIEKRPYIIGDFMWTAMDYLGEAGIGVPLYGTTRGGFNRPYPCVSGGCGVLDLIGYREAESYQAAAAWGQYHKPYIGVRPVNHSGEKYFFGTWRGTDAVSSWTWPGCEGRNAEIEVYSEGAQVELFQDGRSLGKKPLEFSCARFETTYRPGTLKAVSYDKNGAVLGEEELKTAGEKTVLTVKPEESALKADGDDMTFVAVELTDEEGIIKMLSDRKVTVHVTGAGTLAAVGSGQPVTEEPFTGNSYTTWKGRIGFYVRSTGETGTAEVTVEADGVEPVRMSLEFA